MSAGIMTTNYTTITGIPGLAVRTGRWLERWGRRAAAPLSRDELMVRHEAAREAQSALDERDATLARHSLRRIL